MTIWNPADDGYADLSRHDSFVNGAPHNTFSRLRAEAPVAWCDYAEGKGFWSITRHADVSKLLRDYKWMSSAQGIRMEDQSYEEYLARRTFQEIDPPEHTVTRIRVSKAFTRPVIEQFDAGIRELCNEILDRALAMREFDAVQEIARQLPMRMLGRIIGTPESDLDWLVRKGDELISNTDPEYTRFVLDKTDTDAYRFMPFRSPAGAELYDYAQRLMEDKRRAGDRSGVLNLVLEPDENGKVIPENEFGNFFCLLVAAGNDTTRYSIAAALHALCHRPALLEQLRTGSPELWNTAPDEFIRWASPAMHFRRTASRDGELHGATIREGDKVLLWFVSANRDAEAFANPFEVDVTRSPNRHVAFGQGGAHVCLGMWLARLEVRLLLQEFVRRVRGIEQNGPHAFLRSNFVGGIKRLPVRVQTI